MPKKLKMTMSEFASKNEQCFSEDIFYNAPLFETENFKVIPSLGSLIPGWLMIVPKEYYISMGAIMNSNLYHELRNLMVQIKLIVKNTYGDSIIFEHGPAEIKSSVGCTVDYAHIHIVPIAIDLIEYSKKHTKQEINWKEVVGIDEASKYYDKKEPYLFVSNAEGKNFIGTSDHIPSQLFRKTIASYLGIEEMYDWKKFAFTENINHTIESLGKYSEEFV